jgi:hypothetical protein
MTFYCSFLTGIFFRLIHSRVLFVLLYRIIIIHIISFKKYHLVYKSLACSEYLFLRRFQRFLFWNRFKIDVILQYNKRALTIKYCVRDNCAKMKLVKMKLRKPTFFTEGLLGFIVFKSSYRE